MGFEWPEAEVAAVFGRVRVPMMTAKWSRGGRTLEIELGLGLGFEWMGVEGFDVWFDLEEMEGPQKEEVAVRERPRWTNCAIVNTFTFSIGEGL